MFEVDMHLILMLYFFIGQIFKKPSDIKEKILVRFTFVRFFKVKFTLKTV